jgi:hypothetical protein
LKVILAVFTLPIVCSDCDQKCVLVLTVQFNVPSIRVDIDNSSKRNQKTQNI